MRQGNRSLAPKGGVRVFFKLLLSLLNNSPSYLMNSVGLIVEEPMINFREIIVVLLL